MRVCIGGTFNIFHNGHKKLIDKAFEIAGKNGIVFIGVIKGELMQNKKIIISYNERVNSVKEYLLSKGYDKKSIIKPIFDKYGPAIDEEFDAIIVSPETIDTALKINKIRKNKNIQPLEIIKIEYVLAEDNKPISSTRIHENKIDEVGKLINN